MVRRLTPVLLKKSSGGGPRLLLLEFFLDGDYRNERSTLFPFLKGLAQRHRGRARWLCFGGALRPSRHPSGAASFAELSEADLGTLKLQLDSFRPSHIVSSDFLDGKSVAVLESLAAGAKFIVMPSPGHVQGRSRHERVVSCDESNPRYYAKSRWFLDWLGVKAKSGASGYLADDAPADFRALMANESARMSKALVTIIGGTNCGYKKLVEGNPLFKGLKLPPGAPAGRHDGCTFCGGRRPSISSPSTDFLKVIKKQFSAISRSAGASGRSRGFYEIYDIRAFWKFDKFFELILKLDLPPAVFLFNPRLDDVVGAGRRIEETLPALAKAGHKIRLLSVGVENFSERENARFNKGISLAQIDEFFSLTEGWARSYPGVVSPFKTGNGQVELGLILFTPWTTLEDIRINLQHAVRYRFIEDGYWLYSTLRIRRERPIYSLAKKGGDLLVDHYPDKGQLYSMMHNETSLQETAAWRFRDQKVADYFSILVRVCAAHREGKECGFFKGDPVFAEICGLYRRTSEGGRATPMRIALALLELMDAAASPASREVLLRTAIMKASEPGLA